MSVDDSYLPFLNGAELHLADRMGAVAGEGGRTSFSVWAPNARTVELALGSEADPGDVLALTQGSGGIWHARDVDAPVGTWYRYAITGADGERRLRSDPLARRAAPRPSACSIVERSEHTWQDGDWMTRRAAADLRQAPLSIYEVHLGSWRRDASDPGRQLPWAQLAEPLADHALSLGFTHVELLPVTAHPYPGSWGYLSTGYFAPDPRHGTPDELRALIDHLHGRGLGVILDWVPGHFSTDDWALADFDGGPTYEHEDPRRADQPEWGARVFDHSKPQVRSFLLSSARYWLSEFHADGLRIDAVAAMLRHDWGRDPVAVLPNEDGSLEKHESIAFLKELNAMVRSEAPGAVTIAEEATGWPGVTNADGLDFTFAWNMGWANDWLSYLEKAPAERSTIHNDITFASSYADAEDWVLALSHDDAAGSSLVERIWGDDEQARAQLRALIAMQWAHRGKKLLFMGGEFAQRSAWSHHGQLDWQAADPETRQFVAEVGRVYRQQSALWARDGEDAGMTWLLADERETSTYAWERHGADGALLVCAANLSDVARTVELDVQGELRIALETGQGSARIEHLGAAVQVELPAFSCAWLVPA